MSRPIPAALLDENGVAFEWFSVDGDRIPSAQVRFRIVVEPGGNPPLTNLLVRDDVYCCRNCFSRDGTINEVRYSQSVHFVTDTGIVPTVLKQDFADWVPTDEWLDDFLRKVFE